MSVLSKEKLNDLLVESLKVIDGDPKYLPRINESNYEANPFIEIEPYGYYYVCYERDSEMFRMLPFDEEELLYLVFRDITSRMANQWELKHRIKGQDPRRLYFDKQIELMSKIKPVMGERLRQEKDRILRDNPFNDAYNT